MPDHDHDHDPAHEHDLGLRHDLVTLAARRADARLARTRMSRRWALTLLGAGGVGLLVAACGGKGSSSAASTTSTSSGAAGSSSTTAAAATGSTGAGSGSLEPIPEETGGPFPGDGTNGPNVLDDSGVVRSDLTTSFGGMTGEASGIPTQVALTIVDAATGAPRQGAALYLWHCTMEGGYSLYSQGVTDQNYLRGVQVADADGTVRFTTIYPAAYDGRWPHMHFEIFPDQASITSTARGSKLVTSQLALPEALSKEVYATDGYEDSIANLARTSLATDMVFRDGSSLQVPTATGDVVNGIQLALRIGV